MAKMTIEIPDKDYKKLKLAVVKLGVSIKDYVLDAIHLKEKTVLRADVANKPKSSGHKGSKASKKTSKLEIKKC